MRVVIPFGVREPKSRLASVFDAGERRELADAMLTDVLDALSGHDPLVLADAPVDVDARVEVDERPLTPAVNGALGGERPTAVLMADLPLVIEDTVERLLAPDADVVIAPGIGGGTNALVVRHPEFRVDYHGASVRDHRRIAGACDASVATVDSFRLAVDVDEPADLAEVVLHGDGATAEWLRTRGGIETTDGRVRYVRENDSRGQ